MSILVTGGAGFMGLAVVEQLLARGEQVVVLDLHAPPAHAAAAFARLPGRLTALPGDVTTPGAIADAVLRHGVRRMIHAAAITAAAQRDAREPARIANVNLVGTLRAMEAARDGRLERVVYASTGALYGPAGVDVGEPLDEQRHAPDPRTLYGISKFAAERSCLRLRELWDMDIRVGRLGQAYGRWEYASGERDTLSLVTQVTAMALSGREAVIPDVGAQDWIYAPDLAAAIIALLDAPRLEDTLFHLGAEAPFGVEAWCERLAQAFPAFTWRFAPAGDPGNVTALAPRPRTAFSARRLRTQTGWAPCFASIDAAFADYMQWLEAGGSAFLQP